MLKEYNITRNTLAIMPFKHESSIIFENKSKNVIERKPNKIINENCINNGSSIWGRLESTKKLTGYTYKAPIVIKEKDNLIFFPTSSPRLKKVSWINFNNIDYYYSDKNTNKCIIKFHGGYEIKTDVSFHIINSQMYRATKLYKELIKKDFQFA